MHDDVSRPARLYMPDCVGESESRLYDGVIAALKALPVSFDFPHSFSGIKAANLFNLNALIGATIEDQVVAALNRTRTVWDPEHEWEDCMFIRRSQSFPDVRLVRRTLESVDVIMGIELKGWYVLSKEKVPSFRYQVAVGACAPMDLICVVPWYLDNAAQRRAEGAHAMGGAGSFCRRVAGLLVGTCPRVRGFQTNVQLFSRKP